jgi:hypothetical protein
MDLLDSVCILFAREPVLPTWVKSSFCIHLHLIFLEQRKAAKGQAGNNLDDWAEFAG